MRSLHIFKNEECKCLFKIEISNLLSSQRTPCISENIWNCVSVADTISADDKVGSAEYQKVCVTIWYCWYGCLSIEWIIWQYQGGVWLVQIWYQIIECGGWFKLVAESCKNLCICVSQDYILHLFFIYEVICFYFQGHLHFHGCVHFWGCLYFYVTLTPHFQHVLHFWSSSFRSS